MERKGITSLLAFMLIFASTSAQQNAGSSVASSLIECYNNNELFEAERRLPASVNVLIDLIRKAEDGRTTQDARQLSIELIHRFRQDGILRRSSAVSSQFSLPFSPSGRQTPKNRLLLQELIPGTAVNFPNETLNALERCSLHFIMSNVVNTTVRGDEANVCGRLGRYERRTRSVSADVEIFKDPNYLERKGDMENGEEEDDVVAENPEDITENTQEEGETQPEENAQDGPIADAVEPIPSDVPNQRQTGTQSLSTCPIEGGVIYTRWGAVQASTVIAGIASGLEPQSIRENNYTIDSRFAATISGDLAEAALWQTVTHGNVQSVGASGGWTSTQVPRLYYINENVLYEMTDAEIRGGLDGLILAHNVANWRASFSTIKLSQILDMYYSPRGVFSQVTRACNRNALLTTFAPNDLTVQQTTGFSIRFDNKATLPGTITDVSHIATISAAAVERFFAYVPGSLNDLNCLTDTRSSRNRIATDIIIVLDTQWPHNVAHAAISYFLDNLDVNKFGSNFTIINGNDGRVIVNTTSTILDYHQQFNQTVQQQHPTGFQFSRIFVEVEAIVRNRMDNDRVTNNVGGKSTIALFMPFQNTVSQEDSVYARERLEIHRSFIPDLRILVLGTGTRDAYNSLVSSPAYDVFTLTNSIDGTNIVTAVNPLVDRVREIHRRLVNPGCGSTFEGPESTNAIEDYLEPQTINYYRISPNYFYGDGARSLRIRGQGYGNFVVCTSRTDMYVSQNSTTDDKDCRNINSDEQLFVLTGFCTDGLIRDCSPVYLSAESTALNTNFRCSDAGCRFPDNIKFTITLENFVCFSNGMTIIGSFSLIALMLTILKL